MALSLTILTLYFTQSLGISKVSLVFRNNYSSQSVSSQPSIRVSESERYIFSRKPVLNCNYSLESSICRTKTSFIHIAQPLQVKPPLSKIMCLHTFQKQFVLNIVIVEIQHHFVFVYFQYDHYRRKVIK